MKPVAPKLQRCAIYTRKSTEHNLDLTFNSLDAQREACEAYIKSQAHEGWKLVPDHFDDGAFSGASLVRPALQILMEAVRSKKIDIIVVYKVDRLTRSLADFAKLVELFDEHEVSFVSVTQSFNTTSSMGRLTLNVLLSFAQFEREVIGERVRDKISASKRKGIWVGGPIPLGYRSVDKKLQVVPEEATLVRKIFQDYLRLGSIGALSLALEQEGIKPKARLLSNGEVIAAAYFMRGQLGYLLKNRFYVGDVVYKGEVHQGEHPPIIDLDLFEAVQARLAEQTVQRMAARSLSPAILTGLIFDDSDNTMSPNHANKQGIRYRYYVSQAVQQGRKADAGSVSRVSAPDVEALVCTSLRQRMSADREITDRALVQKFVQKIVIRPKALEVTIRAVETTETTDETSNELLTVPFAPSLPSRKGIAHSPEGQDSITTETRDNLLQAVTRARGWMDAILTGKVASFDDIAAAEHLAERYVRRLAVLAFLSPKVVRSIVDASAPVELTVSRLTQALPHEWSRQEEMIGIR